MMEPVTLAGIVVALLAGAAQGVGGEAAKAVIGGLDRLRAVIGRVGAEHGFDAALDRVARTGDVAAAMEVKSRLEQQFRGDPELAGEVLRVLSQGASHMTVTHGNVVTQSGIQYGDTFGGRKVIHEAPRPSSTT